MTDAAAQADEFWNGLESPRGVPTSWREELRHDTSLVAVSTVAGQFYYEFKTEDEFELGGVPMEVKHEGTDLHEDAEFTLTSRKKSAGVRRGQPLAYLTSAEGMPVCSSCNPSTGTRKNRTTPLGQCSGSGCDVGYGNSCGCCNHSSS